MKIGIFDSGLGGLLITRAVRNAFPQYDYVYLGDTKRVPYGDRSHDEIHEFLREGVFRLFEEGCILVIVACNTASAHALRRIQQDYLPIRYPGRRVLGVIIPACEDALADPLAKTIGILATNATVSSGTFVREIEKLSPAARVIQREAPLLVPLIERHEFDRIGPVLEGYLAPLVGAVDVLVLGCTHYPIIKDQVAARMGPGVRIVSQDECVPDRLADYLVRHPEIEQRLSRNGSLKITATDLTETLLRLAEEWFGMHAQVEEVRLLPLSA